MARAGAGRGQPDAVRAAYVAFLVARLGTRQWLPAALRRRRMSKLAYQYVVLRCVPRVDREEFLNVGVVVYCQAADFLEVALERRPPTGCAPWTPVDVDHCARRWPSSRASAPATARRSGLRQADRHPLRLPQGTRGAPCSSRARSTAASPPTRPASSTTCCHASRLTRQKLSDGHRAVSDGSAQTGTSSTAPTA